jgi:transcription elongation factor GreA
MGRPVHLLRVQAPPRREWGLGPMAAAEGAGDHRSDNCPSREELDVSALLPARLNGDETVLVTAAGYERLRAELELLTTKERGELTEHLRQVRSNGDLADNTAVYEALEEQAQLEQRIAMLQVQLAAAEIVVPPDDGTASLGTRVRIREVGSRDEVVYELVGTIDADPASGRLSVEAPVGRALVGEAAGAVVDVQTPRGRTRFELLSVDALEPRREERKAA